MRHTLLILVVAFLIAGCSEGKAQILGILKAPPAYNNAVVVCDGNSLTQGFMSTNPPTKSYPAVLQKLFPFNVNSGVVTNKGVGGQTTQQMIDDAATDIDPLYNGSVKSILVAWECGNDLYFNGDATGAYNRFVEYCQDRQAAGWIVIAVTVPYRDHSVTDGGVSPAGDNDEVYNTKRLAINTNIVNNWETFANGLFDIAANSDFSSYNTTYFSSDRVHFNDSGYDLIAHLILPIILTL